MVSFDIIIAKTLYFCYSFVTRVPKCTLTQTILKHYCGTYLTFIVPFTGTYTIECWGAQGGDQSRTNYATGTGTGPTPYGGRGAYVCGSIALSEATTLYVYVGEEGGYNNNSTSMTFNGGGGGGDTSGRGSPDGAGSRGGGATDVRTISGTWDNSTSLNSRIIIAAGGGGCTTYGVHAGRTGDGSGGAAGGLIGYNGLTTNVAGVSTSEATNATGGTQSGGGVGWKWNGTLSYSQSGGLGFGNSPTSFSDGIRSGGGGAGLYGGGSGGVVGSRVSSGAGGSSYISGHPGCTANSTYIFSSTKMIDGKGLLWTTAGQTTGGDAKTMPTPPGGSISAGNNGHGYCLITGTTATP